MPFRYKSPPLSQNSIFFPRYKQIKEWQCQHIFYYIPIPL